MALPKYKISKSRRNKRRTHWKLSAPSLTECPHCHQTRQPHRACPNCGYYKEREAYFPKE